MTVTADQASRLRALIASAPREVAAARPAAPDVLPPDQAPIVTVASGKGGVGKTTLAVNTAVVLAKRGLRVTLVDLDIGVANADVLLGLSAQRRLTRADLRSGQLERASVETPYGFTLIPGPAGGASAARLDAPDLDGILTGLERLRATCDLVLVDTGAGVGLESVTLASTADHTVVVTTPEPASIADAYAMIKCVAHAHRRAGETARPPLLVVSAAAGKRDAADACSRISRTTKHFLQLAVRPIGAIRRDARVERAARSRVPVVAAAPLAGASRDLTRCARALWGVCAGARAAQNFETVQGAARPGR